MEDVLGVVEDALTPKPGWNFNPNIIGNLKSALTDDDQGFSLGFNYGFGTGNAKGGLINKRGLVDGPGGYSGIEDLTDLLGSLDIDIGDYEKNIQLSDEDAFLRAQILGEENPLYNYTLGGSLDDLIPGLSFEAGVRDDAVMEPGMMSPDDYKFFKLMKSF